MLEKKVLRQLKLFSIGLPWPFSEHIEYSVVRGVIDEINSATLKEYSASTPNMVPTKFWIDGDNDILMYLDSSDVLYVSHTRVWLKLYRHNLSIEVTEMIIYYFFTKKFGIKFDIIMSSLPPFQPKLLHELGIR